MKSNNEKYAEASARQAQSNKLSTQEKLVRLPVDGAKRERAKLTARLDREKNQAAKPKPPKAPKEEPKKAKK